MEMRRKDRQMTHQESLKVLAESQVVRLGVIAEGEPYIVPLNFILIDETLYFHSAKEGRKLGALAIADSVCLEVDDIVAIKTAKIACKFSCYYRSVIAYGEPFLLEEGNYKAEVLTRLTERYCDFELKPLTAEDVLEIAVYGVRIRSISGKQNLPT